MKNVLGEQCHNCYVSTILEMMGVSVKQSVAVKGEGQDGGGQAHDSPKNQESRVETNQRLAVVQAEQLHASHMSYIAATLSVSVVRVNSIYLVDSPEYMNKPQLWTNIIVVLMEKDNP